jgi:signal transduction histidine kinase
VREVDRLKTELLDTVAHELRTPLTSILGFSEILLTRSLDQSRQRRYLQMINDQSAHLSEIVDNLLDVSRLGTGRGLDLNLELIDIDELMQEVQMYFTEMVTECKIQLEGLGKLPLVMADRFRLAQVGRNLLSNAIKYSPQGGQIIVAGCVRSDYVEVTVQDYGIGMTPEQQHYLFEPFYRVDASNTAIGGAGLGLAISKLVIEQHGGQIWLKSEWGAGTTVYFTLPLVDG